MNSRGFVSSLPIGTGTATDRTESSPSPPNRTRFRQWRKAKVTSFHYAFKRISTSHSASINRETCMIVLAGRMSRKHSPCTPQPSRLFIMHIMHLKVDRTALFGASTAPCVRTRHSPKPLYPNHRQIDRGTLPAICVRLI